MQPTVNGFLCSTIQVVNVLIMNGKRYSGKAVHPLKIFKIKLKIYVGCFESNTSY